MGEKQDRQAGLREWLRQRIGRGKYKRSGKELARLLKLDPSQVTRMLAANGRKIDNRELAIIFTFLGEEAPRGLWDFTHKTEETAEGERAVTPARARVRIVAVHSPSMWRSKDAGPPTGGVISLLEDPDPRLDGLEQYAIDIVPGRKYVICVDYVEVFQKPMHHAEVFVRRTNAAGQVEETIRRIEIARGKVRLVLVGPVPKGTERAVVYPSTDPSEVIEIKGLVVGKYEKTF